jgi:hypothetical protein
MKHTLLVIIALMISTAAFANGRDIVDAVEADQLESTLVTKVITTLALQCQRPNLVSSKARLNSLDYKIQYLCTYEHSPKQKATMTVGGNIADSQILITSFLFKNVSK